MAKKASVGASDKKTTSDKKGGKGKGASNGDEKEKVRVDILQASRLYRLMKAGLPIWPARVADDCL